MKTNRPTTARVRSPRPFRAVVGALLAGVLAVGWPLAAQAEDQSLDAVEAAPMPCVPNPKFVTAQGADFMLDGRRFKHVSANTGGLVYANEQQVEITLNRLCAAGVRHIRVDILNDQYTTQEIGDRLGYVLREAGSRGMYVTVILQSFYGRVDAVEGRGGAKVVPGDLRDGWCPQPPADQHPPGGFYTRSFMSGSERIWMVDDCWIDGGYTLNYKPFVETIVTRFRDWPEIFGWDIANEQNPGLRDAFVDRLVDFYTAMAKAIKDKDPRHMVTTGLISTGTDWSGMQDPQRDRLYTSTHPVTGRPLIDYVVVHDYNASNDNQQYDDIWRANNRWNKPVSIEESGIASARSDFTLMQRYYRDMFYGMPICRSGQSCDPTTMATYGSVDSITQFGVEFDCQEIGGSDWGWGHDDFGPCQQNRIADYEALWQDWRKRLDSYNKFPGGIVVDNYQFNNDGRVAKVNSSASWTPSRYVPSYWGSGYQTATVAPGIEDGFTFSFFLPSGGVRTVDAWWTEGSSRTSGAAYVFRNAQNQYIDTKYADQRFNGGQWRDLGQVNFTPGWNTVTVSRWNDPANGQHVVADAVRIR